MSSSPFIVPKPYHCTDLSGTLFQWQSIHRKVRTSASEQSNNINIMKAHRKGNRPTKKIPWCFSSRWKGNLTSWHPQPGQSSNLINRWRGPPSHRMLSILMGTFHSHSLIQAYFLFFVGGNVVLQRLTDVKFCLSDLLFGNRICQYCVWFDAYRESSETHFQLHEWQVLTAVIFLSNFSFPSWLFNRDLQNEIWRFKFILLPDSFMMWWS